MELSQDDKPSFLSEINKQLQSENKSLKNQLNRALSFVNDVEVIRTENREYKDQINESNLKIMNLTNRLQLAQQNNKELKEKINGLEIESAKNTFQNNELSKLKNDVVDLKQRIDQYSQSESLFFNSISEISKTNVSSFIEVINLMKELKNSALSNQTFNKSNKELENRNNVLVCKHKSLIKKDAKFRIKYKKLLKKYESTSLELNNIKENYNLKIKEKDDEILILKEQIKKKDMKIDELNNQLFENDKSGEIQNLIQQISNINDKNEKLNSLIEGTQNQNKKLQVQLKTSVGKSKRFEQSYIKMQEILSSKQDEFQSKNQTLQLKNDVLTKNISELKHENEELKIQNKKYQDENEQNQSILFSKNNELGKVISYLESQMKSQEIEINQLIQIKFLLTTTIQKMYKLILQTENQLNHEIKGRKEIKSQNDILISKINLYIPDNIIEYIKETCIQQIDSTTKNKILTIINNPDNSPKEKIKDIINEFIVINKEFVLTKETLKNKELLINHNDDLIGILQSLVKSFYDLIKIFDNDKSIIEFLTSQSQMMEKYLRNKNLLSKANAPSEYIFNGTLEQRKEALLSIKENGFNNNACFNMFIIQSMINVLLFKDIQEKENDLVKIKNQFNNIFGTDNPKEIYKIIYKLIIKNNEMKQNKRHYLKTKDGENIFTLKQNLHSIISDAITLQNELDVKTQQLSLIQKKYDELLDEMKEYKQKNNIDNNIEKVLKDKKEEKQNDKIYLEQKLLSISKENENLRKQIEKRTIWYKKTINIFYQKQKKQEKQLKATIIEKDVQNNENEQKMINMENSIKEKYDEILKKQNEEIEFLNNKLIQEIKNNDEKNKLLTEKLEISKHAYESHINLLDEQMKRETQIIQQQYLCKSVTDETTHLNEINLLKYEQSKEKYNMFISILNEFDELDNYDESDINETKFFSIIKKIAARYKKLNNVFK